MIVAAAIQIDQVICIGKRHDIILNTIPNAKHREQGFINEKGEFLDRWNALHEARRCNQIITKHSPEDRLLSEDLR